MKYYIRSSRTLNNVVKTNVNGLILLLNLTIQIHLCFSFYLHKQLMHEHGYILIGKSSLRLSTLHRAKPYNSPKFGNFCNFQYVSQTFLKRFPLPICFSLQIKDNFVNGKFLPSKMRIGTCCADPSVTFLTVMQLYREVSFDTTVLTAQPETRNASAKNCLEK